MKLLIAVLALLVFAAPARADWQIDRGLQIARVIWHNPCVDRATIEFMTQVQINYGQTPRVGGYIGGRAFPASCKIALSDDLESYGWEDTCKIIIHESGHLAGYRDYANASDPIHSSNPRSIMSSYVPDREPRCDKRGRPYLELHGVLAPIVHQPRP